MVLLLKKFVNWYFYLNNELADPRTKDYPLMSNPFPILAICSFYLYFVKSLGPRIMQNRQPLNINKYIIAFNMSQIFMCAFLVYKFLTLCAPKISWYCEPVDYSNSEYGHIQLFYTWIYHVIKILDLLDTVFFILRKKYSQISFLHLYHHTGMVVLTWFGTKFLAGGHGLFIGFANCIVHTFMYFYYLISIWDPKYKKSIWWKKYITQLQIGQFLFLVIMFTQILFQSSCGYPKWTAVFFVPQNIFMLALFSDFYYRAYIKKRPKMVKRDLETVSESSETESQPIKEEKFQNSVNHRISNNNKTK